MSQLVFLSGAGKKLLYALNMKTFADRLRMALDRSGMTQADLAAATGMTQQGIGYLVAKGKGSKHVHHLARALGVNTAWLADGIGVMDATDDRLMQPLGQQFPAVIGESVPRYPHLSADQVEMLAEFDRLTPKQRREYLYRMREQAEANNEVLRHLGPLNDQ